MIFLSSSRAACRDCRDLTDGADPFAVPHEFLVLRRPGATSVYQCLVCHSNLTCNASSDPPHWVALTSQGGRHEVQATTPSAQSQPQAQR